MNEPKTKKAKSKGFKGVGMEGFIARSYTKNARKLMMDEYRTWAQKVSKRAKDSDSILEVAPGPGYLSIELSKRGRPLLFRQGRLGHFN